MCFNCQDETFQWYCGIEQLIVCDKSKMRNTIEVMILWDEDNIDDGQLNPTKQILTKNCIIHWFM